MTAAAFTAVYSDWKLIRTRQCVQVVFEVPLEAADQAYQVLGGMPNSGESAWYAIAKLNPETTKEVVQSRPVQERPPSGGKSWHELSPGQQAGVLCNDKSFQKFLNVADEHDAASWVRVECGVESRSLIIPGSRAAEKWCGLIGNYRAWMREPEVV